MSEKRFKSTLDEDTMSIMPYLVSDNEEECFYNLEGCVDLLNEQQSIIDEQKIAIDEMITDYRNLEKENEHLRKRVKAFSEESYRIDRKLEELGIQHIINKQYKELQRLKEENKELKLQLEAFKDKLCELGVSDVKLYGKRYYTGLEEWLND